MLQDLRFAVRLLLKHRGVTLAALTALTLGIGANATVFTLVDAVLLRGLPYEGGDRVVMVSLRDAQDRFREVSYLDYEDWREGLTTLEGLAAYDTANMSVSDDALAPERYVGTYLSANTLSLLGVSPVLGRDFREGEDRIGAPAIAILGHDLWTERYDADPGILGRTIRINGVPTAVVGVMEEEFGFPNLTDLWLPLGQIPGLADQARDVRGLVIMGKLVPGATIEQATSELGAVVTRLGREYPETNADLRPVVETFIERFTGGGIDAIFLAMLGAVGFVLLIACANVANLMLARAAQRSGEIAVRVALGATRWQLIRQLLIESLLLAAVGGVLGFGLGMGGVRLFDLAVADPAIGKPYWLVFDMQWTTPAYLAAICLGSGILFGLAPALQLARADVNETLKEGGGRSGAGGKRTRRWTSALLVGELALTLVLLAGAGLMIRSFLVLYQVDVGVETAGLTTMRLVLPQEEYGTPESRIAFADRLAERLASVPSASYASNLPMGGAGARDLAIDGRPLEPGMQPPTVRALLAGDRYFEVLGLNVRGRTFTRADGTAGREVAIINERFAGLFFGGEDPIGQRIQITNPNAPPSADALPWMTVVGVVPNVRQFMNGDADPLGEPTVYLPYRADPTAGVSLMVRAPGGTAAAASLLREEVRAINPDLPVFNVQTLDEFMANIRWPFRVFGTMFALFAGVALVLSAVGLYAVTARSVTQRTQEIGIRLVLGAQPTGIQAMILRQGAVKVAVGLALGLLGAFNVGPILSVLTLVGDRDAVTLVSIAAVLAAVSAAALLLPARRAAGLDPMAALREE